MTGHSFVISGRVSKIQKNLCAVFVKQQVTVAASQQGAPRGHLAKLWGEAL